MSFSGLIYFGLLGSVDLGYVVASAMSEFCGGCVWFGIFVMAFLKMLVDSYGEGSKNTQPAKSAFISKSTQDKLKIS